VFNASPIASASSAEMLRFPLMKKKGPGEKIISGKHSEKQ
jgi:hypothetical protein